MPKLKYCKTHHIGCTFFLILVSKTGVQPMPRVYHSSRKIYQNQDDDDDEADLFYQGKTTGSSNEEW